MDKTVVAGLATVLAGGLVAMQAPLNALLGRNIGSLQASSLSFAIGLAALLAITALFGGGFGQMGEARGLPWHYFLGGLLGAVYVTTVIFTVRTLGAGAVTAATIAGQLTLSVALDRAGVLGLEERPLSAQRLAGIALLAVGTYLVVADRTTA